MGAVTPALPRAAAPPGVVSRARRQVVVVVQSSEVVGERGNNGEGVVAGVVASHFACHWFFALFVFSSELMTHLKQSLKPGFNFHKIKK
jgi:hypothetical protein